MASHFAFLSYSHKDRKWGDWLHNQLESYSVPHDLVGTPGLFGPIPASLRSIFRDRVDLGAGETVSEKISRHLHASNALVVICSPNAAASRYVNDEIRLFKARGLGRRIFPLIVAGRPGDPDNECFPPALTRNVDADGHMTDARDEAPLAADARDEGDGKELAELKIIAGLLGLDLDVLRKREEIERRRRNRRLAAWTAAMTVLAFLTTVLGGTSYYYREEAVASQRLAENRLDHAIETAFQFAGRATALAEQRGIPNVDVIGLLRTAEKSLHAIGESVQGNGGRRAELQRVLAMMDLSFAKSYRNLRDIDRWWASANSALARLSELPIENRQKTDLMIAEGTALLEVGETYRDKGDAASASDHILRAAAIFDEVRRRSTKPAEAVREEARAHYALGEIAMANDRLHAAQTDFLTAIERGRQAVAAFPRDVDAEIDLSTAIVGVGQVHNELEQYEEAVRMFAEARQIREGLLQRDPRNVKARRFLSWVHTYEAEALQEMGRLEEAETKLKTSLDLRLTNFRKDETNAQFRTDLAWARWGLAEIFRLRGKLPEAEIAASEAIATFQEQLTRSPESQGDVRRVAKARRMLGLVYLDQERPSLAAKELGQAVALLRGVVPRGSGASRASRLWQWDFATVIKDLAEAHFRSGDYENAAACLKESKARHVDLINRTLEPQARHLRSMSDLERRAAQLAERSGLVGGEVSQECG